MGVKIYNDLPIEPRQVEIFSIFKKIVSNYFSTLITILRIKGDPYKIITGYSRYQQLNHPFNMDHSLSAVCMKFSSLYVIWKKYY